MDDFAERMSEMALMFSRASSALSTLDEIEAILEEYEEKELNAKEALEEISVVMAQHVALGQMMNMSSEELEELMAGSDDEDDGDGDAKPRRLKS